MNTLHFKYAVEVEKCGSITQAADNLFMAQPNLSKAIKELEDALGIVIFERSSRGMTPTPRGRAFLAYAKNVISQVSLMEALASQGEKEAQRLSISIPRGSYISDGFANFVATLDKDQDIDVKVKETNSMQTIANVAEGRFQLGIIRYQTVNEKYFMDFLKEKGMSSELIWEFDYRVVMPERHPLANREALLAADLAPYIEITHGDSNVPYLRASEDAREGGKRVYVFERSTQFDLLDRIPEAYMWVSPIPEGMLSRNHLVQKKCEGGREKSRDALVYMKDYRLSALDRRFIDKLFEARNRVAFS